MSSAVCFRVIQCGLCCQKLYKLQEFTSTVLETFNER